MIRVLIRAQPEHGSGKAITLGKIDLHPFTSSPPPASFPSPPATPQSRKTVPSSGRSPLSLFQSTRCNLRLGCLSGPCPPCRRERSPSISLPDPCFPPAQRSS